MAFDPDYIPPLSECKDCWGTGYYTQDCCGEPYACQEYWDCPTCNGTGEVDLRE